MSGVIPSMKLIVFVALVAALAILNNILRQNGQIEPSAAFAIGMSLALANLALAVAGLRTRQRLAWSAYLLVSLAAFLLMGFASPLSALVTLAPSLFGSLFGTGANGS